MREGWTAQAVLRHWHYVVCHGGSRHRAPYIVKTNKTRQHKAGFECGPYFLKISHYRPINFFFKCSVLMQIGNKENTIEKHSLYIFSLFSKIKSEFYLK